MYPLLPLVTPAGRLQSPTPVKALMRRVRDPSQHPSSHFKALVEVQAELKLRRVWIEVHRAAASFERIDELESECAFLERELGLATDFHLGTKLDRISIEI